jgi:hypothetical protein
LNGLARGHVERHRASWPAGAAQRALRARRIDDLLYVCFVGLEGVMPATLTIRPIEEGRYRGRRRGLAVGPPPAWTTETTGIRPCHRRPMETGSYREHGYLPYRDHARSPHQGWHHHAVPRWAGAPACQPATCSQPPHRDPPADWSPTLWAPRHARHGKAEKGVWVFAKVHGDSR